MHRRPRKCGLHRKSVGLPKRASKSGWRPASYDMARDWITLADQGGGPGLGHWRALIDIADAKEPERGRSFSVLENYAANGRFPSAALYRLATVLEALDYLVPIPLWDAANRTPQPKSGYLPETGVLTELQDRVQKAGIRAYRSAGHEGARPQRRAGCAPDRARRQYSCLEARRPRSRCAAAGARSAAPAWPHTETN